MKLKLRSSVRFLASIFAGTGTAVRKDGLATYVDLDYGSLAALSSFDPSTKQFAVVDSLTGEWNKTTLSDVLAVSGYVASSLSPATIGLGAVSFTTQAGLAYRAGARVRASHAADTSKYMEGLVTSYSGTTLTVSISKVNGSGTFSDWNLSLAGDPGVGDMLSTNNGLDFANVPTALNNLGGVSFANTQTLNSAQKLKARTNIGLIRDYGALNILDFGGIGDGATPNDTAFSNAYSALSSTGGCIYFPAGKYLFASAAAVTLPNSLFGIMITGAGSNTTTLYWPNAGGGISITAQNDRNTFHISDLTLTTSQVNSGTALNFNGYGGATPNAGRFFQSDIHNVQIMGEDLSTTPASTQYWATAIHIHDWGAVDVANTNTFGPHLAPGVAAGGNGLIFEGDTPRQSYATLLNVTRSSFNYHQNGVILGDYWQGVTFDQCNWNGEIGGAGLLFSGTNGEQVLATITNSQFDYGGSDVVFLTRVLNATFMGNTFTVSADNAVAINSNVDTSDGLFIIGNAFNINGTRTGTVGVHVSGHHGVIMGNYFTNYTTGISLDSASSSNVVGFNVYNNVTNKVNNPGTGNSVGTAAAGNMTGVVP